MSPKIVNHQCHPEKRAKQLVGNSWANLGWLPFVQLGIQVEVGREQVKEVLSSC